MTAVVTISRKHPPRHATQSTRARCATRQGPSLEQLRVRAKRLRSTPIAYIANESFHSKRVQQEILREPLRPESAVDRTPAERRPLREMPAHLTRLCEAELLAADEERELFRRMNFLKYRAEQLRNQLDALQPEWQLLDEAEQCLAEAAAVRDRIVRANMRLVVAIVKKFVSPQLSFDEILSDGIVTLLGAAEKFDYDRGFRFSTYAYRSIARNVYRSITDRQRANHRFVSTAAEPVGEIADAGDRASLDERTWETLRGLLKSLLDRLDGREQFIVSARYALGTERHIETFQSIADKLGVSKERVRQLEQRAVNKLRSMAVQLNVEELLSPSAS